MKTDLLELKTWTTHFAETTQLFKSTLMGYVPNILGALVVLLVGLVLAKLFKMIGSKVGQLFLTFIAAIEHKYHIGAQKHRSHYAYMIGHAFYWIVLIYFVFFALRVLNIPGVQDWISHFTAFIPKIAGAGIIIYVGFVIGALAKNIVGTSQQNSGEDHYFLAQSLRFSIITVFIIWGLGQLGFNVYILTSFINIILAAILGAAALGFGLGASTHVANMMGAMSFKKSFKIGDRIGLEDHKGIIVDINNQLIVVESADGLIHIPAKKALESICQKSV